jgi:transposase
MMVLPAGTKVFVATQATDMRKSFYGLSLLAKEVFDEDPGSGHLFLFVNRAKNRVKLLYYDHNGFALWCKVLTRGTYQWFNKTLADHCMLSLQDLNQLLADVQLSKKSKNNHRTPSIIN